MRKIMAVHPDIDMLDEMARLLAEKFPDDIVTEKVRNAEDAKIHCEAEKDKPFLAIIVNHSIAPDFKTARNEGEETGLAFLESLEALGHGDVAKILIAPAANNKILLRTQALRRCFLLIMDPAKFAEEFLQLAAAALSDSPDQPPRQFKVVVRLNLEKEKWEYQVKGVGFQYLGSEGTLNLDGRDLRRLVGRSERAAHLDYPEWKDQLLDVGQELGKLLLEGNPPFQNKVNEGQMKAGGVERKSICFAVEKSVHPIALEALTLPDATDFWMVQVPIFRRLFSAGQVPLDRRFLFEGQRRRTEPFSALVIESPADGAAERLKDETGHPLQLEALANVAEEARQVECALLKVTKQVTRIGPRDIPAGTSFKSYLQEKLTSEHWDMVHYVGHSHYDMVTGKGYLLLPGPFVEDLDIEIFSAWLSQTRFLYLSGCRSAEAGFVFELARLQVPGVLGFRWPVDDWAALEFAQQFYRSLFQEGTVPSLEQAFLSTRKAMWRDHQDNKIWAAAMLILQGAD